jgi:large subunit ribosomal protein L15
MKYHELNTPSKKSAKRVGRGIAAGQGKTAGRGTKGQGARAGSTRKPGFEGGQTPLMRRLPHLRGFRGFKPKAEVVYTGQLDAFGSKKVDNAVLAEAGLISSAYTKVKLVVKGDVTKKVTVSLQAASEGAIAAVQKAGGSFEKAKVTARPASKKKDAKKAE